jgi:hypothetical protein
MKKYAILAGLALVLVGGGYAAGRYAAPEKVVVTEKIKEVEKTVVVRVVETDKVLEALKNVSQAKDVHKTKTTVKKADGTVTTTETTDDKTKTDTQDKTNEAEKTKTAETVTKEVVVEKEVTKTIERSRPSWRLSLQTGFDVAALTSASQPYSLLPSDSGLVKYMVLGIGVEHRLVGPLSTGVWANTHGMGGISFSLEF